MPVFSDSASPHLPVHWCLSLQSNIAISECRHRPQRHIRLGGGLSCPLSCVPQLRKDILHYCRVCCARNKHLTAHSAPIVVHDVGIGTHLLILQQAWHLYARFPCRASDFMLCSAQTYTAGEQLALISSAGAAPSATAAIAIVKAHPRRL